MAMSNSTSEPKAKRQKLSAGSSNSTSSKPSLPNPTHMTAPTSTSTTTTTSSTQATNATPVSNDQVHAVRAFNRFYTRKVGVLGQYLASDLSLTDVRVLHELAHCPPQSNGSDATPNPHPLLHADEPAHMPPITGAEAVATDVARALGIDNGYLSRILKRFEANGWISRRPNPKDARQSLLQLTMKGWEMFAPLSARSHAEATVLIAQLGPVAREKLVRSMNTIERLLSDEGVGEGAGEGEGDGEGKGEAVEKDGVEDKGDKVDAAGNAETEPAGPTVAPTKPVVPEPTSKDTTETPSTASPDRIDPSDVILRDLRPGDIGWVLQQHGEIYWREYGWNSEFETIVAGVLADFSKSHDASRERGWIAERVSTGERLGAIFWVRDQEEPTTGVIRLFFVTKAARGLRLGSRLVDAALDFGRRTGYARAKLFTHHVLVEARKLYLSRGFRLDSEVKGPAYGIEDSVKQYYVLDAL